MRFASTAREKRKWVGPRYKLQPGTPDWTQSTLIHLSTCYQAENISANNVQDTIDELIAARAWETFPEGKPYGSLDAMLKDSIGVTLAELYAEVERRRIAQQLAAVPKAQEQSRTEKGAFKPRGNDCPTDTPERTAKQLRAIERAPDVVQEAYREGRISQTLAAKLGPKNPTPEVAAKVAEVAGEIRHIKDRKEVDRVVRDRLGQQKPTLVEQAHRLYVRMTVAERRELERRQAATR